MSGASWPIREAFGCEVAVCPICHEPEPDGLPVVEAFEVTGHPMCAECWEAVCEDEDPTAAAERRSDEIMESMRP